MFNFISSLLIFELQSFWFVQITFLCPIGEEGVSEQNNLNFINSVH